MGFLKAGTPLPWNKSLKHAKHVREHGVTQLINVFNKVRTRAADGLKWGDEVEFHLIRLEGEGDARRATIHLIAPAVLARLEAEEETGGFPVPTAWHPEYGRWMVEATPGRPFGDKTSDLLLVELSMATRRRRMRAALPPGTFPASITCFPMLGAGPRGFTTPALPVGGGFARSPYIPDEIISPHPRFGTLTANIRRRRGEHVRAMIPLLGGDDAGVPAGVEPSAAAAIRAAQAASLAAHGATALEDDGESPLREEEVAAATTAESHASSGDSAAAASSAGPAASALLAEPVADMVARAEAEVLDALLASCRTAAAAASARTGSSVAAPSDAGAVVPGSASRPVDLPPDWLPVSSHVHMDAMAFGMGCCCLQVTFQAKDLRQSRRLYDTLGVLAPLMLALSAATPVVRGRLADTDTRWGIICDSVDCRTPAERGVEGCGGGALAGSSAAGTVASSKVATAIAVAARATDEAEEAASASQLLGSAGDVTPAAEAEGAAATGAGTGRSSCLAAPAYDPAAPATGRADGEPCADCGADLASPRWSAHPDAAGSAAAAGRHLPKSRYSSIDAYISPRSEAPAGLSDLPLPRDAEAEARCLAAGIDGPLAAHVASLFVRDPLVVFQGRVAEVDDAAEADHWESIQSTNWRSMRWKPPPPDSDSIGWRVELRTMEAQSTDFANAALTVTSALFSRVALFFDLTLLVPLSLVDANMVTARRRNAARFGRFYFRRGVTTLPERGAEAGAPAPEDTVEADGRAGTTAGAPWSLLSLEEILMGDAAVRGGAAADAPDGWPGLVPLCFAYLELIGCKGEALARVETYLRFVAGRARGEVPTEAQWARRFIARHPAYEGGTVVPDAVVHDLMAALDAVESVAGDGHTEAARAQAAAAGVPIDAEATARELLGPIAAVSRVRAGVAEAAADAAAAGVAGADAKAARARVAAVTAEADAAARRLRGASFVEEARTAGRSAGVRQLVTQHTINSSRSGSFATTRSFLPSPL